MNNIVWSNWEEWRQVRALLYSPSYELKRRGCHFVAMWNLRGRLPAPVKCTWDLVEAELLDSSHFATGEQARLCYASAVVRMVNLSVEDLQQGTVALPVSHLAAKIGIEKWLVDVRHDCSHHNSMSSLSVLRLANKRLLDWLETEYWEKQIAELAKDESDDYLKQRVAALARIIDNGEGMMRRESGPQLPSTTTATGESATAQEILEEIRYFEVGRLSRCIYLALLDSPDVTRWQQSLQWLDGTNAFWLSYPLLTLTFNDLMLEEHFQTKQNESIATMLLSREYCCAKRDYLRKRTVGKGMLSEYAEDWSREEQEYMREPAPEVFQKELREVAKRCLLPSSKNGAAVLRKYVLPSLRATATTQKKRVANNDLYIQKLEELAMQKQQLSKDDDDELVVDWDALDQLARQQETPQPSITTQEEEVLPPPIERTRIADLKPNGIQEWTVFEWIRGPLGRITEHNQVATFAKVEQAPPASTTPLPQTEEEDKVVDVPAIQKRIRLLI